MPRFYNIDEYGLILTRGGNHGYGDSIGRTVRGAIKPNSSKMMDGPLRCYKYVSGSTKPYIQLYRHPIFMSDDKPNTFSRDHYSYLCIGLKHFNMNATLKSIVSGVRWRLSDKFTQTIDLWLWTKAITGNKLASLLFFMIKIPMLLLNSLNNWFWTVYGGFSKEMDQQSYDNAFPLKLTKRQKWITSDDKFGGKVEGTLFYPTYALLNSMMQLYVMKDSIGKSIAKVCARPMVGTNTVLKILTGIKVTPEEVYGYKPMKGGRWTTKLNERNDRDTRILDLTYWTDPWFVDREFVIGLYTQSKKAA